MSITQNRKFDISPKPDILKIYPPINITSNTDIETA
jgi:hypothetical protein